MHRMDEIGIDVSTDFFDPGHLNYSGQEKLTRYLPQRAYKNTDEERQSDGAGTSGEAAESARGEHGEVMEFAPAGEDGIMEFEPEDEDSTIGDKDTGKKQEYDLERLRETGIDVDAGLHYCAGDRSLYFEMLSDFVRTFEGKLEEAERFYHDKNWHEYEVAVHAMKSNVKMIGATSVSELAKNLEEAAENGDTGFITEHHDGLLSAVEYVADVIRSGNKG